MKLSASVIQYAVICLSVLTYSVYGLSNSELAKLALESPNHIIQLNDQNKEQLLNTQREGYVVVLFTATDPKVKCKICREFESEYIHFVKSWYKDHPNGQSNEDKSKSLFFFEVNIRNVRSMPDLIKYYKIEDVPRFILFRPDGLMDDFEKFTIQTTNTEVRINDLLTKIKTATQIYDIKYYEPTDYSSLLWTVFMTFTVVFIIKRYRNFIYSVFHSNVSKAALLTSFIILMISGYMFNTIKNPRYAGVNKEGDIMYFIPGQLQAQFAIESQIVALLYVSFTIVLVTLVAGQKPLKEFLKGEKHASKIITVLMPITLSFAFYVFVAGFTSIYKVKQSSYPFQVAKLSSLFRRK
ncbi:hypothetical protein TPHA_0C02920 [Tetrapisispora phaffii CBS 4417]|uniref:Thioredoxin domain-containing protein n=1 Tax=Tetrapisispora phaffii (strain ATCC 24235 / CBS 4417 / NBRC 1672 / NRRL Y-8282 / UCD 70-5) TaxID=1071381 RepID=G8BRR9_TETPH|nr:hypothetical protein TPHA_0C02920 [Tetrapisispora phaffii CBS 4417]CCE62445.1 hypothetical protein TPHA_0C02920 [Tetrapisispora phaffii CBS 4417]